MYSVKYKKPGQRFYRTLKNVKGDGVNDGARSRYFILADESRVELCCECEFIFSRERFLMIKSNAEQQIGQPIPLSN